MKLKLKKLDRQSLYVVYNTQTKSFISAHTGRPTTELKEFWTKAQGNQILEELKASSNHKHLVLKEIFYAWEP